MIEIVCAEGPADYAAARELIREYAAALALSGTWIANTEREADTLPGPYGPPAGRLILATCDGEVAGVVGMRAIDTADCDIKRMYVRPAYRGKGIGRALTIAAIEEAKRIGYRRIRLSTMPHLRAAIAIYESLGFRVGEPYRDDAEACAIYMEKEL